MLKHLWYIALILSILGLAHAATAQPRPEYRFEHLSLEQGVANNLVYCMLQDSDGFLWFGTRYGLVRYDGYSYKIYRYNPDDPNSLSNDDVVSLYEDRAKNLWVGTFGGGLNRIDRATGKMTRYTHDPADPSSITNGIVWSICEDHAGMIWLATNGGGLERLDPASGTWTHFRHDTSNANTLAEDVLVSVVEDAAHTLWIATKGSGIDLLDSTRTRFTTLRHDPHVRTSLGSDDVRKVYLDRGGDVWVGTAGGGLNRYDRDHGTFVRFEHDSLQENSLSTNYVTTVIRDRAGICWVGTPAGLDRLDPTTGDVTRFSHRDGDANSLSSSNVVALLEDASGLIWIGSYGGGVDKLLAGERRFRLYRHRAEAPSSLSDNDVHAILEDHAGVLWIGTNEGLDASADSGRSFRHLTWDQKNENSLSGKMVTAIAEDATGALWVGTRRGVSRLDPARKEWSHLRYDPNDAHSLCADAVTAIAVGKARPDEIWIGTSAGLNRFDARARTMTRYVADAHDSSSLSNNYVLSLYEDLQGVLWVGTFGGLNRFDPAHGSFTRYAQDPRDPKSLSNNYCLSMTEDSLGALWIGTGGGLNRLDRASGTFTHLRRKEGLPNIVICGIVETRPGIFWISTYLGLSQYNVRTQEARNFDASDGLQGNMFSAGAYCRRKSGEVLFGGINGVTAFYPEPVPHNTFVPPVAITAFMLFDNSQSNLMAEFPWRETVTLDHRQNFFGVAFAALDYTEPSKNQYAFKLEGFDEDWIQSGNTRFARYMNLSPGEYVLKVRGSNNTGLWNEQGRALRIVITPPFWRTWWFYSLSAAAFFTSIVLAYQFRVRQKVARLTELERVRNAENIRVRKRAADDFHDEFGHKLTKISLLSQVIRRALNGGAPELAGQLDKVIETSNELSMGMRDFLWTLNPDKDTAYDAIIRLKDFGDELFNSCGVGFEVTGLTKELEEVQLSVDWRRHLTLLFKEAMHNAAKHSGCTAVMLAVVTRGSTLTVTLTDDGHGFDPSQKSEGQGLASMHTRAEKLGGTLRIAPSAGGGTVVAFEGVLRGSLELKRGTV